MLWQAAAELWRSSPIVGIEAGDHEFDLSPVGLVDVRTHAEGIYQESLAEGGVVLFAAPLCMFVTVIVTLARSATLRPFVLGKLTATDALPGHQIFGDSFFFQSFASMNVVTLGVAGAETSAQALFGRRRSPALIAMAR